MIIYVEVLLDGEARKSLGQDGIYNGSWVVSVPFAKCRSAIDEDGSRNDEL